MRLCLWRHLPFYPAFSYIDLVFITVSLRLAKLCQCIKCICKHLVLLLGFKLRDWWNVWATSRLVCKYYAIRPKQWVAIIVRSFVCSPFVITQVTSFIIQFQYNFTQELGMTIPRTSFSVIGSMLRLQWLFSDKLGHYSRAFIYRPILILYHTNVKYDNILDKFEFEPSRVRVKATVVGYF